MDYKIESSSFRDNDATVVYFDNKVYRVIFKSYQSNYEYFINSGLNDDLVSKKKIINFSEANLALLPNVPFDLNSVFKIIEVERIPLITYPYEWSFEQLKQAALLTLEIQKTALQFNMTLKDASAYNIQFIGSKAIFIDTTSFEIYQEGSPWIAYRQFCMHFLAPLLIYYYKIPNAFKLLQLDVNGISLEFASRVLPFNSYLNLSALMHIHWHSKTENKNKQLTKNELKKVYVSKTKLLNIIDHLYESIKDLSVLKNTEWTEYYQTFSYSESGFNIKKSTIKNWLSDIDNETIVDAGCNVGEFSYIASNFAKKVIAFDFDESVINKLYIKIKKDNINNIYPLVVDLTSPSPSIGWNNNERISFTERLGKNNTTLALALIHHLAIGNNVPFIKQAEFFSNFSKDLIIEYVPKTDVQVSRLLISRKDIYDDYNFENFIQAFSKYFILIKKVELKDSKRILIHFKRIV
jgi:ribosomal protein L11 methylase PrmA